MMKPIAVIALGFALLLTTLASAQPLRDPQRHDPMRAKVFEMRQAVDDFFEAKASGDKIAAFKAAEKAQDIWKSLPLMVRQRIEERHANTGDRIMGLKDEYSTAEPPAAAAPAGTTPPVPAPTGKTTNYSGQTTINGKTANTTGTVTNAQGQVVRTHDSTVTKDGNTVSMDREVKNAAGQVVRTNDTTITKDGNTVTRDTDITKANGAKVDIDATRVTTGNTTEIDKTATITTPDGQTKTFTFDGQAVKDGNTVNRDGTWTNSQGKTIATVDGTTVKDGNTVTSHNEVKNAEGTTVRTADRTATRDGNTVTREGTVTNPYGTRTESGTAVRDGNTINRQGSSTWTPNKPTAPLGAGPGAGAGRTAFRPQYNDDHDIFGGRPGGPARGGARGGRK